MSAVLTDRPQKAPEKGLSSHKHSSHVHVCLCKGIPIASACKTQTLRSMGMGSRRHLHEIPTQNLMYMGYSISLWFLFWLEIKTQSVDSRREAPLPLQGMGDALILQRFDLNLCEDSGECKSPGAYMGFLKHEIS